MDFTRRIECFCVENGIKPKLSYEMPAGYEEAFGTYDCTIDTVFINREILETASKAEGLFFLYHELRHAVQYTHPERFSRDVQESLRYVILYDGTAFKLENGNWKSCKLPGEKTDFTEVYLSLPYEMDANDFAYRTVIDLLGSSIQLQQVYDLFKPRNIWEYRRLQAIFAEIDKLTD